MHLFIPLTKAKQKKRSHVRAVLGYPLTFFPFLETPRKEDLLEALGTL